MKHRIGITLAALLAGWGIGATSVQAQTWQLGTWNRSRPAVSPYINMLGSGGAAAGYYGIMQPQMSMNNSIGTLQQNLNSLSPYGNIPQSALPQNAVAAQTGMQTGHPVYYNNYQRFFPLRYGTSLGSMGVGGTGMNMGGAGMGMGGVGIGQGMGMGMGGLGMGGAMNQTFYSGTFGGRLGTRR